MPDLKIIRCFWYGGKLGSIENVCLLSMLQHGHQVELFHYEHLENVPEGVTKFDAQEILPKENFLFHNKNGSPSLGADVFRYHMLRELGGIWLDMDVLLLKPIFANEARIYGWESNRMVNNAVLSLPGNSETLRDLLAFTDTNCPIPPFFSRTRRMRLWARKQIGFPADVRDMPWAVFGPKALTHFLRKNDEIQYAKPTSAFYPVDWGQAHTLFLRDFDYSHLLTSDTISVHLWNEVLRRGSTPAMTTLEIQEGSFFHGYATGKLGYRIQA